MKYAIWTAAVIAASAVFAGAAGAGDFLPLAEVHPHFSNGLSPPGRETCDFPQPCWDKIQQSPVVPAPAKRVVVRKAR
jgi:hypothetical protein